MKFLYKSFFKKNLPQSFDLFVILKRYQKLALRKKSYPVKSPAVFRKKS